MSFRPKSEAEVAEAARAWGRMRLLVLAVTEARNAIRCEMEESEEHDYETGYHHSGTEPCWKTREWNYALEPQDASDWCESCLKRHKWHLALVAIKRTHGGRLRRLQRWSVAPATLAAAPDLLNALKAMVASYDGIRDGLTSGIVLNKLKRADAAIAKAEGGAK